MSSENTGGLNKRFDTKINSQFTHLWKNFAEHVKL